MPSTRDTFALLSIQPRAYSRLLRTQQADGRIRQQTRGPLVFSPVYYTCCRNARACALVLILLPKTPTGLLWPSDGGESVAVLPVCALLMNT